MLAITNDSYLQGAPCCQSLAKRSIKYVIVSALRDRCRLTGRTRNSIIGAPAIAPIAIAVGILAFWCSTRPAGGADAVFQLPQAVSTWSSPPAPDSNKLAVSLSNGTEIKSRLRIEGCGELKIKNGSGLDAIVNLVESKTRRVVRSFYVQAGKSFVEKNIGPGTYEIYFSTGKDWDSNTRSFLDEASYGRLERRIEFFERAEPSTGQVKFCGYEVTLQAAEGGDVASLPVDKQTFQAMMDQPGDSARLE
jgi:hypothetical protein